MEKIQSTNEPKQENKMGTAPIVPLLLSMSLPAMLSMLISALYNIVDSMYVARIGAEALSALSIAFPIQMLMVALGVGTGVGINSLVARRLGEHRFEDASAAATHGIFLGICSWIVMALIGIFLTHPFYAMTTSNQTIIDYGCQYIYIVTIFCFGSFVQICIEKTLQATGNMIYPMCSQLLGCVINIVLDPILIFGYFGLPAMGIKGAAIATVFGQICAMFFCIFILITKSHAVHISFKGFRPQMSIIKNIYAVGFPAIIMQAITSVLVTLLNMILIGFSEAAVNVLGIYYKLQSFVFMPVFGLNQGLMPILGYNFGAHNEKRLLHTLRAGLVFAIAIMALGCVMFHVIPGPMLQLFNATQETMEIGIPALKTVSLCFIPAAVGIVFSTLFQAVGYGMNSLIVSLIRQLVCILPVAYMLSKISLGMVWYAFPIAEVIAFIVAMIMFFKLKKKLFDTL